MVKTSTDITPTKTLLIVGTDASGKDHIANIVEKIAQENSCPFEKRKRYLCGKKTREKTSTAKTLVELILEKGFLLLFPYLGFLIPWLINILLRKDVARYQQPKKFVVIVGHNCLRGLAFYWGHKLQNPEDIPFSASLERTFETMRNMHNLHIVVLDIEDSIRKKRIEQRRKVGEADIFDVYMAKNSERSERIEGFLVWLVQKKLGGKLIENNDLSEKSIRGLILQSV